MTSIHPSVDRAVQWLNLFNERLETKFGDTLTGSKDRAAFWRFLIKSLRKVYQEADPIARLVAVAGIAVRANCGMLPPKPYADMLRRVGSMTAFPIYAPLPTGKDNVDDAAIPRALAAAIKFLPGVDVNTGVSPLPVAAREYLIDHVYKDLERNNTHIHTWVHGPGGELEHWVKDFADFAEDLKKKLGVTVKEQGMVEEQVADELEQAEVQRNQHTINFLQTLSQTGLPSDPEEMNRIFREFY